MIKNKISQAGVYFAYKCFKKKAMFYEEWFRQL